MDRINHMIRRTAAWALVALLLAQPIFAMAQGADGALSAVEQPTESEIKYYALATLALKLRVSPETDARGIGSIPKGANVYIIDFVDDDWAYVTTERNYGYVQRQFLDRVSEYTPDAEVLEPEPFVPEAPEFREAYKAYAVTTAVLREEPSADARVIESIPTYKEVIVSETDGEWCYARYKNSYGYINCNALFKWDRLVADAGAIPNLDILPLMIFVKRSTNIYATKDNAVLKTINPGAAVASFEKDNLGRYIVPYWRTTGYINEEDVAYVMPVAKDCMTAQPGELLSVMSTYYAVGVSTLQFQGRNWNIHLAASMINGYVLQPNENYDQYQVIGPYRKSTGYHYAPVMKKGVVGGYGGGTCQVNTTFYITNMQLPILVTHRKVHADVGIYYAPKGQDAAVGGGDINLTLVNTMPYPIRYQFFDSDGVITCCIFRAS